MRLTQLLPLICALVAILATVAPFARAEENPLDPTPHATVEAAIAHAERHGRTADAAEPVAADVVGALSKGSNGRFGFMPLLQHHMAVEHWFVEGVDEDALADAFAGTNRCYVRLRGKLTSLGIFGGSGLGWYGTGLNHGREWGPVMGYHERVYRFEVSEVVWARSRSAHLKIRADAAALAKRVQSLLAAQEYAQGRELIRVAIEAHRDTGLDVRDLEILRQHSEMMVHLLSDPNQWSGEDLDRTVQAILGKPTTPFRELRKGATARLQALIASWPRSTHEALGPRLVDGWMGVEYRHVRQGLRPVLEAVDSDAIRSWKARLLDAESRLAEIKERLSLLRETDDYAGMLALMDEAAPHQALALDYAFGERQTMHWVPASRRLAALKEAFEDPGRRTEVLVAQVRETIASHSGLPNSNQRPRYNEEIAKRFAPRLDEAERNEVETVLLEILKPLDARKQWQKVLLGAELLACVGGDRAKAFFPELLKRTKHAPKWQREHLARFAAELGRD